MRRRSPPLSAAAIPALLFVLFWAVPTPANPYLVVEVPRAQASIRIDDDSQWAQLRFSSSDITPPPYIEIPPEEIAFEALLRGDQQLLRPLFGGTVDSAHLQPRLATEYFQIYLNERPSRTATRSLAMAFTLWGNAASIDAIRQALPQISGEG